MAWKRSAGVDQQEGPSSIPGRGIGHRSRTEGPWEPPDQSLISRGSVIEHTGSRVSLQEWNGGKWRIAAVADSRSLLGRLLAGSAPRQRKGRRSHRDAAALTRTRGDRNGTYSMVDRVRVGSADLRQAARARVSKTWGASEAGIRSPVTAQKPTGCINRPPPGARVCNEYRSGGRSAGSTPSLIRGTIQFVHCLAHGLRSRGNPTVRRITPRGPRRQRSAVPGRARATTSRLGSGSMGCAGVVPTTSSMSLAIPLSVRSIFKSRDPGKIFRKSRN